MKIDLPRWLRRRRTEPVMGHHIPEPRLTWQAGCWLMLYLGVPVLLLGTLVDALIQWVTGYCTGFWCWF